MFPICSITERCPKEYGNREYISLSNEKSLTKAQTAVMSNYIAYIQFTEKDLGSS